MHIGHLGTWFSNILHLGEDGLKNFYTFAYHIKHGDSLYWFSGMNHPWGEHVVFTDNQPLFAGILQALAHVFPWMAEHPQATLMLMLLSSFALGAFFLYDVMRKCDIPLWFSLVAAVGIMILSPQWNRLAGHFALAYAFVIPMSIWLNHRWYLNPTNKRLAQLAILPTAFGFIHPYLLVMTAAHTGIFMVIYLWQARGAATLITWTKGVVATVLPLLLFQLILMATDPVGDRPSAPYGYLVYAATYASVFLPIGLKHGTWIMDSFGPFLESPEGSFYVGAFAMLIGILAIAFYTVSKVSLDRRGPVFSIYMFLASIPILLISLGLPFSIEKLEGLLDYTGPFRQFRGIGRFAFVFFYSANLFAAVAIGKWLVEKRRWALFVAVPALFALHAEGFSVAHRIGARTANPHHTFQTQKWKPIDAQQYSAILPFPYYHVGSENFRSMEVHPIVHASMALSYETGLPLLSVHMSRTSLSQTLASIQMVGEQLEPSEILQRASGNRWLILVENAANLPPHQQALIAQADLVEHQHQFDLYSIEVDAVAAQLERNMEFARVNQDSALVLREVSQTLADTGIYYYGFENLEGSSTLQPETNCFRGGCFLARRRDWTPIIPPRTTIGSTDSFELTFWVNIATQNVVNTQIWYWERIEEEEIDFRVTEIGDHIIGILGDWGLARLPIQVSSPNSDLEILLHRDGEDMFLWLDEVVLRPVNLNVFREGEVNLNNRFYKPLQTDSVR